MLRRLSMKILIIAAGCLSLQVCVVSAQNPGPISKKPQPKTTTSSEDKASDAAHLKVQQRAFAISLLMSLAEEARSYDDLELRARVLARTADTLWAADRDAARTQFRRAWEAAEKADEQEVVPGQSNKRSRPVMVIALKKAGSYDVRSEVLILAARRDRALGDEFIANLAEETKQAAEQLASSPDSWSASVVTTKRLVVARRLLDEGQTERAVEFALPVLTNVNEKTISFLSALRLKRSDLADDLFVALLDRAAMDPFADANTVSGLSSYAFTPGFYVTFAADGSVRWTPSEEEIPAPPLPANIQTRFFCVAAAILLRPSPPPDEDRTSAGRTGRYLVIKRLLPLFEQHAPDTALALRSELTKLAEEEKNSFIVDANIIQAWEVASEVVKAANNAEEFTGDESSLTFPMISRHGLKMIELPASDFSLNVLFASLAKKDLTRASELANGFLRKPPHAVATISIAKTILA
jgi:hypothetical protein